MNESLVMSLRKTASRPATRFFARARSSARVSPGAPETRKTSMAWRRESRGWTATDHWSEITRPKLSITGISAVSVTSPVAW